MSNQYYLEVPFLWFKRKIAIELLEEKSDSLGPEIGSESARRIFPVFGIPAKQQLSETDIRLSSAKYIEICLISLQDFKMFDDQQLRILTIHDVVIEERHRSKGFGSQLMNVIDVLAHERNCDYIVGELEMDDGNGSLQRRKKFFNTHGFHVSFSNEAHHSGWTLVKKLNDRLS